MFQIFKRISNSKYLWKYEFLVNDARKCIQKSEYKDAITYCDDANNLIPKLVSFNQKKLISGYFNKGIALFYLKSYDNALKEFSKVLSIDNTHCKTLNFRGVTYFAQKSYSNAKKDFFQCIELKPKFNLPFFNLAKIEYKNKNYDLVISFLQKSIRANPKHTDSYFFLGLVNFRIKDLKKAEYYLSEALKLSPENSKIYFQRSNVRLGLGKLDESFEDWFKAKNL